MLTFAISFKTTDCDSSKVLLTSFCTENVKIIKALGIKSSAHIRWYLVSLRNYLLLFKAVTPQEYMATFPIEVVNDTTAAGIYQISIPGFMADSNVTNVISLRPLFVFKF